MMARRKWPARPRERSTHLPVWSAMRRDRTHSDDPVRIDRLQASVWNIPAMPHMRSALTGCVPCGPSTDARPSGSQERRIAASGGWPARASAERISSHGRTGAQQQAITHVGKLQPRIAAANQPVGTQPGDGKAVNRAGRLYHIAFGIGKGWP